MTQHVPFDLVDAVLEETGATQRRLRDLPSRVGVYFLLALGLFPGLGYAGVWSKLVAGLRGLPLPRPSEKALRDLRRRVGTAPMRALFDVLAVPLARPTTPGARYRNWRTVAFDGCSSLKIADTERNIARFGKVKHHHGWAGYPALMLMTLVETGTRGLLGAVFGTISTGETEYATRLLSNLRPDMLVLIDRGFDGNAFLAQVAATGAQLLARAQAKRRPPVLAKLPDGTFLSRVGDLTVRILDADIVLTGADGTRHADRYRLITTLLDHHTDPAQTLVRLYHERWEIESAYLALRHTLLTGRVLRSGDPVGVEQEMWSLLTLYQALRTAMVAAVESRPGTDPDRASFTIALETAHDQVTSARNILPTHGTDLVGDIGRAVLARLLPARRARFSARKVKCPTSRYATRPATDVRPLTSTRVASMHVVVHQGHTSITATEGQPKRPGVPLPPRTPPPTTPAPTAPPRHAERRDRTITTMTTDPHRSWHGSEVAQALGITNIHSFGVQMSQWARQGLITKTGRNLYTLAPGQDHSAS